MEDDDATRVLLRRILESQGCEVDEAKDGQAALALLQSHDYGVILLDIVLPKVSGTEIMERLTATRPELLGRIIVVTGLNIEELRKLFPTVGMALPKPVIPQRLRESIHQCLRSAADESLTAH